MGALLFGRQFICIISMFWYSFIKAMVPSADTTASPTLADSLDLARSHFYKSVKQEAFIKPAAVLFEALSRDERLSGLSRVYTGALVCLQGKHVFLPIRKLQYVNQGLAIMDEGITLDPGNIESRFIRGSTCHHLPFFFNRGDTASVDFQVIAERIPRYYENYEPEIVIHVIEFLLEKAELKIQELEMLTKIKEWLSIHED
jgi:hypothetical protein